MKFRKLFILIVLLLTTSACSGNYDLEFKNGVLHEEVSIIANNINENADLKKKFEEYSNIKPAEFFSDGGDFENSYFPNYKQKFIKNGDSYELNYKSNYNIKNFSDTWIPGYCVEYFNFLESDNNYIISTGTNIRIFDEYKELDDITVHIKTNHKLVDTNADETNGYNYYWHFDRDTKNKNVYLEVSQKDYVFNYENEILFIVFGIITVIVVIISIVTYLYKKNKKLNEV